MRASVLFAVVTPWLCGALLAGCDGGSVSTHAARAVPAAGSQAVALGVRGGGRKPDSVPSCIGLGTGSFVGGGFENVADGAYSGVLEGNSNEVCDEESAVAGGYYNFISSGANTSYYSFIGSGYDNSISGNGYQSVIGGGNVNALTAPNSVIGGGNENTLSGSDAVIAGGSQNSISSTGSYGSITGGSGNTNAGQAAVVGGNNDSITSAGTYSTIGGGNGNSISGRAAVIAGGAFSVAGGQWATIPGGLANTANGELSFAAGYSSNAAHAGAFVWSDTANGATQLSSTAPNQFQARATGGFMLWTNASNTVGATLASGSGTWASASDRSMKTDVAQLDEAKVLDEVAKLPITSWSYITERGVRHVGPMAQDFYAAFRVGADDRHITSIDEDGVALAAIKALHAENASLRTRLAAVTDSQSTMERELRQMRQELEALRAER